MHAEQQRSVLAANIRARAAKKQISLRQLARVAPVSFSQLHNVLSGNGSPTVDWLSRLARALDTEVYLLMKP